MAEIELADVQNETNAPESVIEKVQETPERQEPDKKLSLRDELVKNFKDSKEPKAEPKPVKVGERLKDPGTGKFVAKDAVEAPSAPAKEESPATVKDAQPAQASKPVGPPPGWSPESKALFETLPPSIKADVLKRENEVSNGFKQYSDKAKRYDELEPILAPRRHLFQQSGLANDAQAISTLMQWEEGFRTNPVQAIVQMARLRGIDLSTLAQQASEPSTAQELPPQLRQVTDQFGGVVQSVQSIQQRLDNQDRERVLLDISSFSKDKPHFEKVRVAMGQLMQAGAATSLDDAYQKAIWADEEIRSDLIREQNAAAQKTAQEKAQAARTAAVSVTSRSPTGAVSNGVAKAKSKGVRGSILSAIEEVREDSRA